MFSHVTVGSNDLDRAAVFYSAVLPLLDLQMTPLAEQGEVVGWCWDNADVSSMRFYIVKPFDDKAASVGNGAMVAFKAKSRSVVDQAFAAGIASGGTSEGAPGERAHYAEGYYGAYLRDPDGNKLHLAYQA